MLKTEHLESSIGSSWGTNSAGSEESAVDANNVDDGYRCFFDDEDIYRFSEMSGDSKQDGDADEDEDEDQDVYTTGHKHKDQRTDTDEEDSEDEDLEHGKGEDEALNETLDIAVDKQSARNEDETDINALSTPQTSKADPTPTPEPHHDTIALGQHHLWMI